MRARETARKSPDDILLSFVPMGPINNIPALDQIMAWRRPGDKPLSEPMMMNLLTHICVTRHQQVNNVWLITQLLTMANYIAINGRM